MATMRRRMTLPSISGREDPIHKPSTKPAKDPAHGAALIFVHGLADSAAGVENIADQFQQNNKLPHLTWIIPNARENRDVMDKAWYTPSTLSAQPPSRPELAPDEDEDGMLETVAYLESLIDACVNKGIPPNRIVLGGFSQGMAMSLLTDLTSKKYSGKLAGIVGLMGYLPLHDGTNRVQHLRAKEGLPPSVGEVPMFLARGLADKLIPKRVWQFTIDGLKDLGVNESAMEVHEYEGLGHTLHGRLLGDLCTWLEKVIPALED